MAQPFVNKVSLFVPGESVVVAHDIKPNLPGFGQDYWRMVAEEVEGPRTG